MPLTTGITSGAYNSTWNALNVGPTQPGGFRQRYSKSGREVKFDSVGDTPIDVIQLGMRMFIDMVLMDYNLARLSKIEWPWNSVQGEDFTAGRSLFSDAKPFVMTACRNDINPLTRTYPKTIIATGYDIEQDFSGMSERVTPIRLLVFPVAYNAGGYATPTQPTGCGGLVYFFDTFVV